MVLKKQSYTEDEIAIFEGEAFIYKRGEYWQFRMWLNDEKKYARKSLRTRSKRTAIEKAEDYYLEIRANKKIGKKYFSLTTKEGVEKYIEYRKKDVETGLIVAGRLSTIKTHLQHFLRVIGKDTKLRELGRLDCEDYFYSRHKQTNGRVKAITIQNEQSTINACILWLYKNNETYINAFDFKKLPKIDINNEAIRRATFTGDEQRDLYMAARTYAAKKQSISSGELYVRQLIKYYILIAGNSGLRVGEQMQLKWGDIKTEEHKTKHDEITRLAKITVRAETSKVRKSRILYARKGHQFDELYKLTRHGDDEDLIFSLDGKTRLSQRTLLYHFHKLVGLADIKDGKQRGLVPYSLRHFMITERITSGLSYQDVANMCGTSVQQIEKTYYHLNDEIRRTNALADYKFLPDGTIVVI